MYCSRHEHRGLRSSPPIVSSPSENGRVSTESEITLGVLTAIEQDSAVTQRSLARDLGIALGLANAYLKRCAKKGLVKISQAPANRYAYYLVTHLHRDLIDLWTYRPLDVAADRRPISPWDTKPVSQQGFPFVGSWTPNSRLGRMASPLAEGWDRMDVTRVGIDDSKDWPDVHIRLSGKALEDPPLIPAPRRNGTRHAFYL